MGCDQTTCITPCLIRSFSGSHSISQSPSLSSSHPEISVFLQLFPLFPVAPFYCSLHLRKTVSEDGPWEWSDGARRLSLAKQGPQAFVYASAPLVAKSSLKTRHKEAAEEPDTPPSALLHDLSRFPQARCLRQRLPGSLAEKPGQSNCSPRSRQAAFCLPNYSKKNLEGDKGSH